MIKMQEGLEQPKVRMSLHLDEQEVFERARSDGEEFDVNS